MQLILYIIHKIIYKYINTYGFWKLQMEIKYETHLDYTSRSV